MTVLMICIILLHNAFVKVTLVLLVILEFILVDKKVGMRRSPSCGFGTSSISLHYN